jgi:hypothetical protein
MCCPPTQAARDVMPSHPRRGRLTTALATLAISALLLAAAGRCVAADPALNAPAAAAAQVTAALQRQQPPTAVSSSPPPQPPPSPTPLPGNATAPASSTAVPPAKAEAPHPVVLPDSYAWGLSLGEVLDEHVLLPLRALCHSLNPQKTCGGPGGPGWCAWDDTVGGSRRNVLPRTAPAVLRAACLPIGP